MDSLVHAHLPHGPHLALQWPVLRHGRPDRYRQVLPPRAQHPSRWAAGRSQLGDGMGNITVVRLLQRGPILCDMAALWLGREFGWSPLEHLAGSAYLVAGLICFAGAEEILKPRAGVRGCVRAPRQPPRPWRL